MSSYRFYILMVLIMIAPQVSLNFAFGMSTGFLVLALIHLYRGD